MMPIKKSNIAAALLNVNRPTTMVAVDGWSSGGGGGGTAGTATAVVFGPREELDDAEAARRERRRRRRHRAVTCLKEFIAFLFSHVGLAGMVVAYSIMGGFLFRVLEVPEEMRKKTEIAAFLEDRIKEILVLVNETTRGCAAAAVAAGDDDGDRDGSRSAWTIDGGNFSARLRAIVARYQEKVVLEVKSNGWDGRVATDDGTLQWSFAGALLYAVTVITTIGKFLCVGTSNIAH